MFRVDAAISKDDQHKYHRGLGPRVYEEDGAHQPRIALSRQYLKDAIRRFDVSDWPLEILELGCGAGDISGPEHGVHNVRGIDINEAAIATARKRWPLGEWECNAIEDISPSNLRHVILLCEVLEHLDNPMELVRRWLPLCDYSIISHPFMESKDREIGGAEHVWLGLSEADMANWFKFGGHEALEIRKFDSGAPFILGFGRRVK